MSSLCLVLVVMLICFEPVFGNFCLCSVCVYLLSSIIIYFEPVFSNFCLIIMIIYIYIYHHILFSSLIFIYAASLISVTCSA